MIGLAIGIEAAGRHFGGTPLPRTLQVLERQEIAPGAGLGPQLRAAIGTAEDALPVFHGGWPPVRAVLRQGLAHDEPGRAGRASHAASGATRSTSPGRGSRPRPSGKTRSKLGPPGLDQVRRAHDDRAVRSCRPRGHGPCRPPSASCPCRTRSTGTPTSADCRVFTAAVTTWRLRGQHGPLQVQCDHGVRGRDVQRLERLPGAIGHQRAVAIQVFLEGFTVHGKSLRGHWSWNKLGCGESCFRHGARLALASCPCRPDFNRGKALLLHDGQEGRDFGRHDFSGLIGQAQAMAVVHLGQEEQDVLRADLGRQGPMDVEVANGQSCWPKTRLPARPLASPDGNRSATSACGLP